jgi:hypothetical protein
MSFQRAWQIRSCNDLLSPDDCHRCHLKPWINQRLPRALTANYLLDPNPYQRADTISHIVTDIVKTCTEIDTLPKQVAILYIINKLLTVRFLFIPERYLASGKVPCQWLIMRSEDSYNNMPTWLRPKAIQIQIPHPSLDRPHPVVSARPCPLYSSHLICDLGNQRPDVREYLIRH